MIYMSREKALKILNEPNGPEKLAAKAEQAFVPAWALYIKENNAAAGAFLCRLAKQKKFREAMADKLCSADENARFCAMLLSDNAKLRKNTARLMGALEREADAPRLIDALEREQTRFVRPSIILSIGAIGGEEAKAFLEKYTVPAAKDESEKRHFAEETDALLSARRKLTKIAHHAFRALDTEYEFELRAPDRLVGSLLYDMEEEELEPYAHKGNSVFIKTKDIDKLMRLRSMQSILMPIARDMNASDAKQLLQCGRFMREFFENCCDGEPPYGYRIELRGEVKDRAAQSRAIAAVIDSEKLVNAPSDYEAELIFEINEQGRADAFLQPTVFCDDRFTYRTEALPASIHPATAAAVLRYAMEHMKVNARVLDPCCGSGTLLIEREKLAPAASLTGVDIAHRAIDIARKNAENAGSKAKFICNDMLRFEAKRPYDEIVANLPFGNRVGTHVNNEKLYAGLLDRLPQWLNEDGVAILYTMEFTLLKKLIRERPKLKLVTETRTEAGGLMPGIFIIKLK